LTPEDFKRLPKDGVRFEEMTRMLLEEMGYRILEKPASGTDAGSDVLVERVLKDEMIERHERVVVQCKHYAHSGNAVGDSSVGNWQNAMTRFKAKGYLLVTSTSVTVNLRRAFDQFTEEASYSKWASFWNVEKLIEHLNKHPRVREHFFPPVSPVAGARRIVEVEYSPEKQMITIETQQSPCEITEDEVVETAYRALGGLERIEWRDDADLASFSEGAGRGLPLAMRIGGGYAYRKLFGRRAHDYLLRLGKEEQDRGMGLSLKAPLRVPLLWEMLWGPCVVGGERVDQFLGLHYLMGRSYYGFETRPRVRLQDRIVVAISEVLRRRDELEALEEGATAISERTGQKVAVVQLQDAVPVEAIPGVHWPWPFEADALFHEAFGREDLRYGLVHLTGHWEEYKSRSEPDAVESCLALEVHGKRLLVGSLMGGYGGWGFGDSSPLVFLNICQPPVARLSASRMASLAWFVLGWVRLGASGVIGPVWPMPHSFAHSFASEFYRRLFGKLAADASANIGETLLETRCHFVEEYENPLGLFYVLHGPPDQQLTL
jgi:hypothetical protein